MNTRTQAFKLVLAALALGAGVIAQAAAPVIQSMDMVGANPRLGIQSEVGSTNQIEYATNLSQTNWTVLTNLVVAASPFWFVDMAAALAPQRFYRVVAFPIVPPNMALIPAGSFMMGDAFHEGYNDELPLHTVDVSAFYMDKYKVTKALWDDVYNWAIAHGYSFNYAGAGKAPDHPAHAMSWFDAVKWCNARSQKEGLSACYYTDSSKATLYMTGLLNLTNACVNWTASGYRLPTEAEWEKAARGGAGGHRFPWADADTIDHSRANYVSDSSLTYDISPTSGVHPTFNDGVVPYTSPVGYFAANGYGLYDMAGNMWEWCWDWYDGTWYSKAGGRQKDTQGPDVILTLRMVRGGSWSNPANEGSRCADRQGHNTPNTEINGGFRCVRRL